MCMPTIEIPESLAQEIEQLRDAGFTESAEAFAHEAIREKLLAARRIQFDRDVRPLERDLAEIGLSEGLLLNEFDRFRHAAHADR